MTCRFLSFAFATLALAVSGSAAAQSIRCESIEYQRAYCPTGPISGAQIVAQTSRSMCAQGRTWGWDGGGIWVSSGCQGDFAYQPTAFVPPQGSPGRNTLDCESRDYQQNFCRTGANVARAWVVQQHSQAPCIEGQTWGWDNRGVWVNQGCSAVFAYQAGAGGPPPMPPPPATIVCESRNYLQSQCGAGVPLRRVWVAEQRSQAPCIEGQTWGWNDRAVWVNAGCSAVFAYEGRY